MKAGAPMQRLFLLTLATVALPLTAASGQTGHSLQEAVDKALHASEFKDLHGSVVNGVVTLTGVVDLYKTRLDAEVHVARLEGVRAIRDNIQVAGPAVSDAALQREVQHQVHTKAISVEVRDGVVHLEGASVDPLIAWNALSQTAKTPGVHGIVDHIATNHMPLTGAELGPAPYTISSVP